LRYRIGDLVQRSAQPYDTSYIVHGRVRDALRDSEGRRVTTWDVDQCFENVKGIVHYQLHQEKDGQCQLHYIPEGKGPEANELKSAVARIKALLQPSAAIEVESVDKLPPTPSGKFRLTMSAAA
jgi:acyl-coenzyme A synthetase/AMP-(fatty) acid ligase